METRNISLIVFYTKDKKILLQDRSFKNNPDIEWGFFGGGIDEGETPEEALVRETKEELTYDLKDYKFIGNYEGFSNTVNMNEKIYLYISPIDTLDNFIQEEGTDMKLFTIEEARNLKMANICYPCLDMIEKEI